MQTNPFSNETFAAVPREILLAPNLSLAAKGLYGIICAMPQLDEPVSYAMVEEQFPGLLQLESAWDEMVSFLEQLERRQMMQEALEELIAAQSQEP